MFSHISDVTRFKYAIKVSLNLIVVGFTMDIAAHKAVFCA